MTFTPRPATLAWPPTVPRVLFAAYNGPLYQVMRQSDGKTLDIGVVQPVSQRRRRIRQRRRAGRILCQHLLLDHPALRSVRQARTTSPGPSRRDGRPHHDGRIQQPAPGRHGPGDHHGRAQGVRRLSSSRAWACVNNDRSGTAVDDQAEGAVLGRQRPPLQFRLLLRLRQRRNRQPRRRRRHHGDHVLRQRFTVVSRPRPRPLDHDRPGKQSRRLCQRGLRRTNSVPTCRSSHGASSPPWPRANPTTGRPWAATGGELKVMWDGRRVDNRYDPMRKQGAIVLGNGGDNSNSSQGTFYEGAMTARQHFPSTTTDQKVQANVVAAKYDVPRVSLAPGIWQRPIPGTPDFPRGLRRTPR